MRSYATNTSDDQKRVVIIIADTLIRGVSVQASAEPVVVDAADAATLVMYSKAEYLKGPLPPETLAAAVAQTKDELLQKIGEAQSVEELEELLSEDPDIVAAYERRIVEIDAREAGPVDKANLMEAISAAADLAALEALIPKGESDGDILAAVEKRKAELTTK